MTSCQSPSNKEIPQVIESHINLANWDFSNDGIIALDGKWEFYWQQLLSPEDFKLKNQAVKTHYISLPKVWNGYLFNNKKLSGEGFATYRATLHNISTESRYALKLLNVSSAYTLWLNGQLIASNGKVGISKDSMIAQYRPQVVAFEARQSSIELILQVSNFHHRRGGAWNALELGYEEQIRKKQRYRDYFDVFLLGALLIMGGYHLALYALRHKDTSTLYFGLFCLVIGVRSLFYHEMIISLIFTEMRWEVVSALRYILNFSAPPLLALFIHSLYPIETSKKMISFIIAVEVTLIFLVLTTTASIYTYAMPLHQIITLLLGTYTLYVLIKAAMNKRASAYWLLVGFFAFFIIIINDILTDHEIIRSIHLASFGLLLFILSQAFVLSMRFSRAFDRAELLTSAYERFVPNKFLNHLDKDDIINVQLGDNIQRNMTILFADIRSFTSMSETMTPQENFNFLNSYLGRMEPVITHHQGFIDKYIGDAIMALFEQNADDAINAGVAMLYNLEKYNHDRNKAGYQPINIGIGINTGELMLGIIGGKNRMDGTVISDAVNLAARMEALTKIYQTPLLISKNALDNLSQPEDHFIRMIDHVQVNGKTTSISIYEVFDTDPKPQLTAKVANKELFTQAIQLYSVGNYKPAQVLFQRCLYTAPNDKVVHIYLQRIERLLGSADMG
jgi:class 3 adenylate cyclase